MMRLFIKKLKAFHKIIILCTVVFLISCGWIVFRHFRYQNYINAAETSEKNEQYVDAVIYYAMASHIYPKEEDPYVKMAECYIDRSEMDQAMAILSVGKTKSKNLTKINKKLNELQDFVEDDIDVNTVDIPEYTLSSQLKRRSKVDDFIEEMRTYNGENGAENYWAYFYKGYYYYADLYAIYRTKGSESNQEQLFHIDDNDNLFLSNVMIANNRIYFYLDHNKIVSVKTDGSDYKELKTFSYVGPRSATISNGWINYYDVLNYNEEKPFPRITLSGEKDVNAQTPIGNYSYLGAICFDRSNVYYISDEGIMKSARKDITKIGNDFEIDSQKEEHLIHLSSKELEHVEIYINDTVLLYRLQKNDAETSDEADYEWHAYDLEQNKDISFNFSADGNIPSLIVLGDWIYYSEEINNRWTLYRKNRFTDQTDKIKEISYTEKEVNISICICNDQLLILYEDEDYHAENLEFVDLSAL